MGWTRTATPTLTGRLLGHRAAPGHPGRLRGVAGLAVWLRAGGRVRRRRARGLRGRAGAVACTRAGVERGRGRPTGPREVRRRRGKSDPVDAEAAARAVLAGRRRSVPRRHGPDEIMRSLRLARAVGGKARAQAENQHEVAGRHRPDSAARPAARTRATGQLVAAAVRPAARDPAPPTTRLAATEPRAARSWPRHRSSRAEVRGSTTPGIGCSGRASTPALLAVHGVGVETAATLLVTAGDNPDRLRSRGRVRQPLRRAPSRPRPGRPPATASTAAATATPTPRSGASPSAACTWRSPHPRLRRTPHHRRQTKPEIIRCLKRYIAREIYTALLNPHHPAGAA